MFVKTGPPIESLIGVCEHKEIRTNNAYLSLNSESDSSLRMLDLFTINRMNITILLVTRFICFLTKTVTKTSLPWLLRSLRSPKDVRLGDGFTKVLRPAIFATVSEVFIVKDDEVRTDRCQARYFHSFFQ